MAHQSNANAEGNFTIDLIGIPIGMFGSDAAGKKGATRLPHKAGDLERFDFRFRAQDFSHGVIHDFDAGLRALIFWQSK